MSSQKTLIIVDIEDMQAGDAIVYRDRDVTLLGGVTYGTDKFGRKDVRYMARTDDGREGYIIFGTGIRWTVAR